MSGSITSRQSVQSIVLGVIIFAAIQQVVMYNLYYKPHICADHPHEHHGHQHHLMDDLRHDEHTVATGGAVHGVHVAAVSRQVPVGAASAVPAHDDVAAASAVTDTGKAPGHAAEKQKRAAEHEYAAHPGAAAKIAKQEALVVRAQPKKLNLATLPDAGPGQCVSMKEAASYYCMRVQEEKDGCAKTSHQCDHLPGCDTCKAGAAIFWPGDESNCLQCLEGWAYVDAGFTDCTGSCRELAPGEAPQPLALNKPNHDDPWDYENLDRKHFEPQGREHAADACRYIDLNITQKLEAARSAAAQPLVAMVTTIGASTDEDKQMLQLAAATSWVTLEPDIITLVAVDSADVPAPRGLPRINCEGDPAGTPFVSNLFVAAEDAAIASGATFAGFSNGDIAYDDSLMSVLRMLAKKVEAGEIGRRMLVVGKRLNIDSSIDNAADLVEVYDNAVGLGIDEQRHKFRKALIKVSKKRRNSWMTPLAEDFFFFIPGTFAWDQLPNWVIGRVGWDSFLTQWAQDEPGIDVIDASKMIHAAHLTGDDGNAAGWNTAKPDKVWNYCAMHHMCDSNAAWAPHCSSCFRCKLGGTEQSNLIVQRSAVQPGATMDPADFYETAKRVPPTQIDQGKVHDESVQILNKFGVDATNVDEFVARVDRGSNESVCHATGNCCSLSGSQGVEYELGMRWQVRSEWPVEGNYAAL